MPTLTRLTAVTAREGHEGGGKEEVLDEEEDKFELGDRKSNNYALQRQMVMLQRDWAAYKESVPSPSAARSRHRRSTTTVSSAIHHHGGDALAVVQASPRDLMSSLQQLAGGDLAAEMKATLRRRAEVRSGKVKGRRLLQALEDAAADGQEAHVSAGKNMVIVLGREDANDANDECPSSVLTTTAGGISGGSISSSCQSCSRFSPSSESACGCCCCMGCHSSTPSVSPLPPPPRRSVLEPESEWPRLPDSKSSVVRASRRRTISGVIAVILVFFIIYVYGIENAHSSTTDMIPT